MSKSGPPTLPNSQARYQIQLYEEVRLGIGLPSCLLKSCGPLVVRRANLRNQNYSSDKELIHQNQVITSLNRLLQPPI